jgi:hypothetical protein
MIRHRDLSLLGRDEQSQVAGACRPADLVPGRGGRSAEWRPGPDRTGTSLGRERAKASQSRRTTAVKPKPEVARTTPKSQSKSMARFKELGPLGAMQNCGGHVRFGR